VALGRDVGCSAGSGAVVVAVTGATGGGKTEVVGGRRRGRKRRTELERGHKWKWSEGKEEEVGQQNWHAGESLAKAGRVHR